MHRHDPASAPHSAAPANEQPNLTGAQILAAVAASLRRLQTTYIDLYQLHWWVAGLTCTSCFGGWLC